MQKAINKYLLILLIIVVATIIRLYPIYQYSLEPSLFDGAQVASINYILETGHSLPSARGEVLLNNLEAIKILLINSDRAQNLVMTSLFQSLTFSLVVLLFARHANINSKTSLDLRLTSLIVMFSISAIPGIISRLSGWNGPYAWIFYLSSFYIVLCKDRTFNHILLSLFFLFLVPLTYYTEANVIVIILVIALFFSIVFKESIFTRNFILIYVVFFISWLMYASLQGFSGMFRIIDFIQSYYQHDSRILTLNYIAGGTQISQFKNAFTIALSSIPLIYCILKGKHILDKKLYNFFLLVIGAISCLSILFFLWMGITGILQRIPLLTIIFSIVAFSLLATSRIEKKHLKLLCIVVLLAVISSNIVYTTYDYPPPNLSFGEAEGTHWLMKHMYKEQLVFVDFRVSAPFVANGYHTSGIDDLASAANVDVMLEKIYYNKGSPVEAFKEMNNRGEKVKYLFFTERSTERFPGIKGYDYNFEPAPKNFIVVYNNLSEFNTIYKNNDVTIILLSQI